MTGSRADKRGPGQDSGQPQPGGQQGKDQARGGQFTGDTIRRDGKLGDQSGDIRNGGDHAADGTVWGNINTGNNSYGHAGDRPTPAGPSTAEDAERTIQQGLRELNQLQHLVQNDPQAAKEVAELARQMQRLDPSRFPGNPAMVERMQRDLLSSIDKLELLLRREGASSVARTGKSDAVPTEYQESVADYYRRLSKNP